MGHLPLENLIVWKLLLKKKYWNGIVTGMFQIIWLLPVSYTHLDVYKRQAEAYGRKSDQEKAKEFFNKVLELDPENVQTKQIIDVLKKYLDFNFAVSVIIRCV